MYLEMNERFFASKFDRNDVLLETYRYFIKHRTENPKTQQFSTKSRQIMSGTEFNIFSNCVHPIFVEYSLNEVHFVTMLHDSIILRKYIFVPI